MHPQSEQDYSPITAAEPQLFVADIEASLAFYTERLGFALVFRTGDPAFYAQIIRDAARLNLRSMDGPVFVPGIREREVALSATMTLADATPLFGEYRSRGVDFFQKLRAEPWGAHTFIVRDPDGNLLAFAGR